VNVVQVRGKGLMWGIELDPSIGSVVFESLKDQNFLVGLAGQRKNVLRVMPPMCITEEDLDHFHAVLYKTMEKFSTKKK
jgi:acetylornithine/succinyldiaminopimelate/putrescine aminotransferase